MLEYLSIRHYCCQERFYENLISACYSENMIGAENQQERLLSQWFQAIPENIGWYLSGFVDGEGSFSASLRKGNGHRLGWQVQLTFNVAQRDVTNLELLKQHLGCGRLQDRSDGVHYFVVGDYRSIIDRVIPFFEKFSFLSESKERNFFLFKKIAFLMGQGKHLDPEGLREIVFVREELNKGKGRRRKYNQEDVEIVAKESSETTRQTSMKIEDDIVRTA